jgi:protein gp37
MTKDFSRKGPRTKDQGPQQKGLNRTGIDWCNFVWNPITGCSPVSEGCEHCWAKRFAQRVRGRFGYPPDDPFRPTFRADRLFAPYGHRGPGRVFVGSMGDLFHPDFTDEQIDPIFAIMGLCGRRYYYGPEEDGPERVSHGLTFFVLTKRPQRMAVYLRTSVRRGAWYDAIERLFGSGCGEEQDYFGWWLGEEELPRNVWVGVSAENQERLDERIGTLMTVPTHNRFLSLEPLLGPITIEGPQETADQRRQAQIESTFLRDSGLHAIRWAIAGPETGPGARPANRQWFEDLRDECARSGVPLFIKDAAPEHLRQRQFPPGLRLGTGD